MNGRNKAIPASYLYLERENKILLLKRKNTGYQDGFYSLIAGHVEQGENFTDCLIREAREEAGIILEPDDVRVVHTLYRNDSPDFSNQRMDVFFTADSWEGTLTNREPEKCEELLWCDRNNLPDNIIPYIREVLDHIAEGKTFSERGWVNSPNALSI